MDKTEFATQLNGITATLTKVLGEVQTHTAALEAAIAQSGNSTPEMDAALAGLKAITVTLDDLNPDPVPEPEPTDPIPPPAG